MSKVLITGATGFVGKELCRSLIEDGHQVVGVARSPEKLSHLAGKMRFVRVEDIGPDTEWEGMLAGVDNVIYLAARVHVMREDSRSPLAEYRKVNTAGVERLAWAAVKKGIRRIVYLSTIKVNGEATGKRPFTEESIPSPNDPYAQSKWEAEQILRHIAEQGEIEIVIIRPPLIYGAGVGGNFMRLINWIDRGIPLPFKRIDNRRSLIYLSNLVDAIIASLDHPDAAGEIFLVSDGRDVSTGDLIRMVASAMSKKPRLISVTPSLLRLLGSVAGKGLEVERLVGSLRADSSKIRKTVGWNPSITMEKGIYETVKWYQMNKAQRVA